MTSRQITQIAMQHTILFWSLKYGITVCPKSHFTANGAQEHRSKDNRPFIAHRISPMNESAIVAVILSFSSVVSMLAEIKERLYSIIIH